MCMQQLNQTHLKTEEKKKVLKMALVEAIACDNVPVCEPYLRHSYPRSYIGSGPCTLDSKL